MLDSIAANDSVNAIVFIASTIAATLNDSRENDFMMAHVLVSFFCVLLVVDVFGWHFEHTFNGELPATAFELISAIVFAITSHATCRSH